MDAGAVWQSMEADIETDMRGQLVRLYAATFGAEPEAVTEVAADGSSRKYFRLIGSGTPGVVGGFGHDREENRAFFSFTRAFHAIELPVPELYATSESELAWLEEDLGDRTLFRALVEARRESTDSFPGAMRRVYERVLTILPRFQVEGGRVIDYSVAYPRAAFDRQSIAWDLNYFKYHFLKLAHVPFNEERLERDFERLTALLLTADCDHFLYRDFQSRNIMLRAAEPWFIDYQGGRRGALQYDVASLLYDAKADIPEPVREQLLDHYLASLESHIEVDRETFHTLYHAYVLVRIMQALGAYGYRGFYERKPRFLQSVPFAARNLEGLLQRGLPADLPELYAVFGRIVAAFAPESVGAAAVSGLEVRVTSFSYRRGYPDDVTGHGGGFVFDCRAIPNPGRLAEYAHLSGLDPAVVAFIEGSEAATEFWGGVSLLVDAQIEEYLRRGFNSLTVAFGCTGGQHRSVYFSERLARHVHGRFPQVHVHLAHRERGRWARAAQSEHAASDSADPVSTGTGSG